MNVRDLDMVWNFYAVQTFELLLKKVQHYKEIVKFTFAPEKGRMSSVLSSNLNINTEICIREQRFA
jgi:hypothetical protein